jgi:uncharacterized membrane protein
MKPLIVLVASFVISCLVFYFISHNINLYVSGRIAMAVMLLFTAMGHFMFTKGMALMVPEPLPYKEGIVQLTGIVEIGAAVGLVIPSIHYITGVLLNIFFILMLPANIIAAKQKINLEKASYDGQGISYLWFRIPLQVLFIGWVLFFAVLH